MSEILKILWILIVNVSSLNAGILSPPCRNTFGDTGNCLSDTDCKKINGIPIGVCTSLGSKCCHSLSCSHENLKALNETHSRRKRSIINELHAASIEPACGYAESKNDINDQALDEILPRSARSRQEQLINGLNLENINRFPWMLGLWKSTFFNSFLPTCGAALISLKHAITAAHCVSDQKVMLYTACYSTINAIYF